METVEVKVPTHGINFSVRHNIDKGEFSAGLNNWLSNQMDSENPDYSADSFCRHIRSNPYIICEQIIELEDLDKIYSTEELTNMEAHDFLSFGRKLEVMGERVLANLSEEERKVLADSKELDEQYKDVPFISMLQENEKYDFIKQTAEKAIAIDEKLRAQFPNLFATATNVLNILKNE